MEERSQLSIEVEDSPDRKSRFQLHPKQDISDLEFPNEALTKSDLMFLQDIHDYSLNQGGNKSSFVIMDDPEK
jgi:hypothetical protein